MKTFRFWLRVLPSVPVLILVMALGADAHAAQFIQGAVSVPASDAPSLDDTVGCRIYSISGAADSVNLNQCGGDFPNPCCPNLAPPNHVRCIRTFSTAAGGLYNCNQESTSAYNGDADQQTFYNLIDAEANSGTSDHVGYFAVQGQIAGSLEVNNPGDARAANCAGTVFQNCFTRADGSNSAPSSEFGLLPDTGSTLRTNPSLGGLSPIPIVHGVVLGGGCPVESIRLLWNEPWTYPGTMKNGVASPVIGVNLYSNASPCGSPPNGTDGWVLEGQFPLGAGSSGTCYALPFPEMRWFALTVRVRGPSSASTTLETGRVDGEGFVGANSACFGPPVPIRISRLQARYLGRRAVSITFTSGLEGGVSGFRLYRSFSAEGPFGVASDVIQPTGDGTRYAFVDHVGPSAETVFYKIQIEEVSGGTSFSGTTSAAIPAPRARRLRDR